MKQLITDIRESIIGKSYLYAAEFLEKYCVHIVVFIMRLWMARIFWFSGLAKLSNWTSTLYLFEYEYKVPLLPTEFAAIITTSIELSMPPLMLLGLMTRLSTIPLLVMTAVIQFTYIHLTEHLYWSLLLSTILCYGPGKLSLDFLIYRKYIQKQKGK